MQDCRFRTGCHAAISPVTNSSTIAGYGVSYILVRGFTINAPHAAGGENDGIKFTKSGTSSNSHIVIVNNKIQVPSDGKSGIKINQTESALILGNWVIDAQEVGIDLGADQMSEIAYNYVGSSGANNTFGIYVKMGTYASILHDNYVVGGKLGLWIGQSRLWVQ